MSQNFNKLDPLITNTPPLKWELSKTFLKVVSPSLVFEAKEYILMKKLLVKLQKIILKKFH